MATHVEEPSSAVVAGIMLYVVDRGRKASRSDNGGEGRRDGGNLCQLAKDSPPVVVPFACK